MMPGFLLHVGATITCMHAGQAQPLTPYPRVMVGGQPIVTQNGQYAIAGCSSTMPCAIAQWVTSATRVKASGVPVLLIDSQATCIPTGSGLMILVTQTRVGGI